MHRGRINGKTLKMCNLQPPKWGFIKNNIICTLLVNFWLSEAWQSQFLFFKPTCLWYYIMATQANWYIHHQWFYLQIIQILTQFTWSHVEIYALSLKKKKGLHQDDLQRCDSISEDPDLTSFRPHPQQATSPLQSQAQWPVLRISDGGIFFFPEASSKFLLTSHWLKLIHITMTRGLELLWWT